MKKFFDFMDSIYGTIIVFGCIAVSLFLSKRYVLTSIITTYLFVRILFELHRIKKERDRAIESNKEWANDHH